MTASVGRGAREKGAYYERAVVAFLNGYPGLATDRMLREGRQDDKGDLTGLPWAYIQCKNRAELRVQGWWTHAVIRAGELGLKPVLIFGVPGLSIGTSIVWTLEKRWRLADWAEWESDHG